MSEDWSKKEVALIVEDYFNMLIQEGERQKYSKTDHRKQLVKLLNNRSDGSVEFKHQNISAVLANMGLPYIKGYKPRFNYQQMLEEQVALLIQKKQSKLEPFFENFAKEVVVSNKPPTLDFKSILVEEPASTEIKDREPVFRPVKINYLEREQNNRQLGIEGEEFVYSYEKWRLDQEGKRKWIKDIKWVSKEQGDGLGFDILSKNADGTDRYIEVKTTKLSKESPIYLSRTEIAFAAKHASHFYLYRVFNFGDSPGLFIKQGNYQSFCKLEPVTYRGVF